MILLYEKKIAVITPPKTASTTLLTTLCLHPHNGIFCIGPSAGDGSYYDQHSNIVPPAPFEWKRIAVVRHPLQRFVSLWGHLAREQVINIERVTPIEEFVDIIANNVHPFYFYQSNQNDILGNYDYEYIHVENLIEELIKYEILKEGQTLPQINTFRYENTTPDYKDILNIEMIEKLKWWWMPDMVRFNYDG